MSVREQFRKNIKFTRTLGVKLAVSIMIFSLIFFNCIIFFGGFLNARYTLLSVIKANYNLARSIAISIDQEYAESLFENTRKIYESIPEEEKKDPYNPDYLSKFDELKTDEYYYLQDKLQRVALENNVSWISLQMQDDVNKRTFFVLDSDEKADGRYSTGWITNLHDYSIAYDDIEYFTLDETYNNQGMMVMARAPYYRYKTNEVMAYVMIGEVVKDAYTTSLTFTLTFGGILLILTLIFIVTAVFGVKKSVINPITDLAEAAEKFVKNQNREEESHIFSDLNIHSHDEIELLANSMSSMEHEICGYMNSIRESTKKQERIKTELDVASRIQAKMLPFSLTGYNGPEEFGICADMHPAKEVGGDFYDYFTIDDDHIGITISDVSDKGIPASLLMVTTRTLIKNNALNNPDPTYVMKRTNTRLCENNEEAMFVTVFFGIYTVSEKKLRYVNAGHENPLVYRKQTGGFDFIEEEHDLVLGISEDLDITERSIQFESGDRFFLYTDGVPDSSNSNGMAYGLENMKNCLNRHSEMTGQAVLDALHSDINSFAGDSPQFDDMTLLLLDIF